MSISYANVTLLFPRTRTVKQLLNESRACQGGIRKAKMGFPGGVVWDYVLFFLNSSSTLLLLIKTNQNDTTNSTQTTPNTTKKQNHIRACWMGSSLLSGIAAKAPDYGQMVLSSWNPEFRVLPAVSDSRLTRRLPDTWPERRQPSHPHKKPHLHSQGRPWSPGCVGGLSPWRETALFSEPLHRECCLTCC